MRHGFSPSTVEEAPDSTEPASRADRATGARDPCMARKKKTSASSRPPVQVVARNKKARFQYEVLERHEAGMVLRGSEVKALREGGVFIHLMQSGDAQFEDWKVMSSHRPWRCDSGDMLKSKIRLFRMVRWRQKRPSRQLQRVSEIELWRRN